MLTCIGEASRDGLVLRVTRRHHLRDVGTDRLAILAGREWHYIRLLDDRRAPKRRIATPAAAQGAYYTAKWQERQRDARYGDIRGIYDGFPRGKPS